ncbi:MAG: hypothetical protein Q7R22_016730 [Verrucomicrobiota bacterium JB025]|nr:hypothetical protein [Verrucomicrobiota bacterium JB025]
MSRAMVVKDFVVSPVCFTVGDRVAASVYGFVADFNPRLGESAVPVYRVAGPVGRRD